MPPRVLLHKRSQLKQDTLNTKPNDHVFNWIFLLYFHLHLFAYHIRAKSFIVGLQPHGSEDTDTERSYCFYGKIKLFQHSVHFPVSDRAVAYSPDPKGVISEIYIFEKFQ